MFRLGSPSLSTRRRILLKWLLFVFGVGFALSLDLVTKQIAERELVLGEMHKVLPFLYLQRTANSGVAFGLLGGKGPVIIAANVLAMLVVLGYVYIERRPLLGGISGGLIVGGSLGNLVQRIAGDGHVTDFLKFPHWPNYNLADVFIFVGIGLIFLGLALESVRIWRAGRQTPASG